MRKAMATIAIMALMGMTLLAGTAFGEWVRDLFSGPSAVMIAMVGGFAIGIIVSAVTLLVSAVVFGYECGGPTGGRNRWDMDRGRRHGHL